MTSTLTLFALMSLIGAAAPAAAEGKTDEVRARIEHRIHLMRLVELSDSLGLADDKAMKIEKIMVQFDERRAKLRDSTQEARKTLKRAADGDQAAQAQIDQAVDQLINTRRAMVDIDRDTYQAISKELTPAQRAKFVLFIGEFRHRMESVAHAAHDKTGGGGPMGPSGE
jgi:Spy/CpxP family protein refolding chaperone